MLVAVHDGLCQRLMERGFNVQLAPVRASESRNEMHELIYEWGDDRDLTGESLSQFNESGRTNGDVSETACAHAISPNSIGISAPATETRHGSCQMWCSSK